MSGFHVKKGTIWIQTNRIIVKRTVSCITETTFNRSSPAVLIVCSKDSSKEVQKDLLETYSEIVSNCVKVVVFRLKTKSRNEFQLFYNGRDRAKSGLYLLWKTCSVSIYFILDLFKPGPCRGLLGTNDISINRR